MSGILLLALMIVVPDSPTAVERSAAEELQDGIRRMTGGTVAIGPESSAGAAAGVIFVGATRTADAVTNALGKSAWKDDAVLLKSVPDGLVLTGHPRRGVFYAVDEYLERFCGVRWWTSTESHYPKLDRLPMSGVSLDYAPRFRFRETHCRDSFFAKFKVRTKGNFSSLTRYMLDPMEFVPPELGGDHRFFHFKGHSVYHTFFKVLPPDGFFARHPEWYAEYDEKRQPLELCLCNGEMAQAFAEELRKKLRTDPTVDFVSVSQCDDTRERASVPCQCAKCRAIAAEEGAPSGGLLRFVNRVAEILEPEFPHVTFDTFAYTWSRTAPKKTRPRHNVTVRYCDIECSFAYPLDTPGDPVSEKYMENLRAWSAIAGGNLYVWDYIAGFRNYMLPHPNVRSLARNVRIFAEAGAVGVFEQGDVMCPAGEFAAYKHYLVSHLLWDPQADEKKLTDDFLKGYYGPAAEPKVREYLSLVNDRAFAERIFVRCFHYNTTNFLDTASAFRAEKAMADAVRAAQADGPDCVRRVRREKLSIDQVLLVNWPEYRPWAKEHGVAWPLAESHADAVESWISAARSFGVKGVHEAVTRGDFESFCQKLRAGNPDR